MKETITKLCSPINIEETQTTSYEEKLNETGILGVLQKSRNKHMKIKASDIKSHIFSCGLSPAESRGRHRVVLCGVEKGVGQSKRMAL